MSKFVFVAILGLSLLSLVLAHGGAHDHDHDHDHDSSLDETEMEEDAASAVVSLNSDNFDAHIDANEVTLVEFYAPWCGHCKSLAPEYDAASLALKGIASVAKVDCTEQRELCTRFEVEGFPTVKLFRNDRSDPIDYAEQRKADAIVQFVKRQKAPVYATLADKPAIDAFVTGDFAVVAFLSSEDTTTLEAYQFVAKALRNEFQFAIVTDPSLFSEFTATTPAILIFRTFDEPRLSLTGPLTNQSIAEFVLDNAFPLLGVIGPDNFQRYIDRGYPLYWVFINVEKDKQLVDSMREVAKQFRSRLSFVQLDGVKWAEHAKSLGLNGATPGLVIEDRENRKNYVFSQSETITVEAVTAHVQAFLAGTLSPTVRSEPIPATNDGPVKTVVGKTFDSIVLDTTKDVLLEVYAPWCGHCKTLAPKFEKLGQAFRKSPSVVIAKIDGTENDIPFELRGYPTLIFYPANDKQNPITYTGDRTEDDLQEFIRKHALTLKKTKGHDEL